MGLAASRRHNHSNGSLQSSRDVLWLSVRLLCGCPVAVPVQELNSKNPGIVQVYTQAPKNNTGTL